MGTEPVSEIVWRVRQLVHDSSGARWSDAEMIKWVNDGLNQTVLFKPTANSIRISIPLAVGTIQDLPASAFQLLRITHNTTGESCRVIDQDRLDAANPMWRVATQTSTVEHYMYEPEIPREFQVYPANDGTGSVEATVSGVPTRVVTMTDPIPLDNIYGPVLVDYLLYRAYSKHSKFAGNEQRAANAYQRFAQSLGMKVQSEGSLDPNITNVDAQGTE
jgi:hypothetical protein